jgi:ribosomal protein S18 acetylase RimI-like enzyme
MELRFLTSADAAEWLGLRIAALEGDPEAFSASLEEWRALGLEEVKRRLWPAEDAFVLGAFDGERMVGMAGFYREKGPKTRHKGHVWGVYVAPEVRGRGIGRRMMQTLLQSATGLEGVEQILVSVATSQTAAVNLYRSIGFEPFGREPRALKIGEEFIDEEHMILDGRK